MSISGSHRRRKQFPTRWSSGTGSLSFHGEGARKHVQISNFFSNQSSIFGLISVWVCHIPSPVQYPLTPVTLLHPLVESDMLRIGLWQLKPRHLDPVLPSFSSTHPNRACTPVLQRLILFSLFLFVICFVN